LQIIGFFFSAAFCLWGYQGKNRFTNDKGFSWVQVQGSSLLTTFQFAERLALGNFRRPRSDSTKFTRRRPGGDQLEDAQLRSTQETYPDTYNKKPLYHLSVYQCPVDYKKLMASFDVVGVKLAMGKAYRRFNQLEQ